MQTSHFSRLLTGLLPLLAAACSGTSDNPYANLEDPPLVEARLHTVTLVSGSEAMASRIIAQGYVATPLAPNYPQANAVEASIWGVPEPVAEKVQLFKPAISGAPDLRLLVMPLAARGRTADQGTERAFFRNVLGTDVPQWPLPGKADDQARVQVWTYLVPDVLEASKRLRASGIPVIYDPVAITTSYLGDYKSLAIRAPDGTVVHLVETAAQ